MFGHLSECENYNGKEQNKNPDLGFDHQKANNGGFIFGAQRKKEMPPMRIELMTFGLQDQRSATEL